jgi:GMP synthase (glutamine-hydrolysing)
LKSAIAIRFVHFENLGTLETVLREQGYEVRYLEAASGEVPREDALAPDLVVTLGGPIGAYEDTSYPLLKPVLGLLEQRIAADLPTLGVCLGAQLLARTLGARVYPGSGKEIGWSMLHLTADGLKSPVRHLETPVLHWHGDTFDLPRGAALLASTEQYEHQAFALGRNIVGLQFHPEVTAAGLEYWYVGHACEIAAVPRLSVPKLRASSIKHTQPLQTATRKFFIEWMRQTEMRETAPVNVTEIRTIPGEDGTA